MQKPFLMNSSLVPVSPVADTQVFSHEQSGPAGGGASSGGNGGGDGEASGDFGDGDDGGGGVGGSGGAAGGDSFGGLTIMLALSVTAVCANAAPSSLAPAAKVMTVLHRRIPFI